MAWMTVEKPVEFFLRFVERPRAIRVELAHLGIAIKCMQWLQVSRLQVTQHQAFSGQNFHRQSHVRLRAVSPIWCQPAQGLWER